MEPKTTNVEGEKNLVDAGREVGVDVAYHTETRSAVLPATGVDLSAYSGGMAGALISCGFALCVMAAALRRRK